MSTFLSAAVTHRQLAAEQMHTELNTRWAAALCWGSDAEQAQEGHLRGGQQCCAHVGVQHHKLDLHVLGPAEKLLQLGPKHVSAGCKHEPRVSSGCTNPQVSSCCCTTLWAENATSTEAGIRWSQHRADAIEQQQQEPGLHVGPPAAVTQLLNVQAHVHVVVYPVPLWLPRLACTACWQVTFEFLGYSLQANTKTCKGCRSMEPATTVGTVVAGCSSTAAACMLHEHVLRPAGARTTAGLAHLTGHAARVRHAGPLAARTPIAPQPLQTPCCLPAVPCRA